MLEGEGESTQKMYAQGYSEAIALMTLKDQERIADDDAYEMGWVDKWVGSARKYLSSESRGQVDCGSCVGCDGGVECVWKAAHTRAQAGEVNAKWALEGDRLIGRRFTVCLKHIDS